MESWTKKPPRFQLFSSFLLLFFSCLRYRLAWYGRYQLIEGRALPRGSEEAKKRPEKKRNACSEGGRAPSSSTGFQGVCSLNSEFCTTHNLSLWGWFIVLEHFGMLFFSSEDDKNRTSTHFQLRHKKNYCETQSRH